VYCIIPKLLLFLLGCWQSSLSVDASAFIVFRSSRIKAARTKYNMRAAEMREKRNKSSLQLHGNELVGGRQQLIDFEYGKGVQKYVIPTLAQTKMLQETIDDAIAPLLLEHQRDLTELMAKCAEHGLSMVPAAFLEPLRSKRCEAITKAFDCFGDGGMELFAKFDITAQLVNAESKGTRQYISNLKESGKASERSLPQYDSEKKSTAYANQGNYGISQSKTIVAAPAIDHMSQNPTMSPISRSVAPVASISRSGYASTPVAAAPMAVTTSSQVMSSAQPPMDTRYHGNAPANYYGEVPNEPAIHATSTHPQYRNLASSYENPDQQLSNYPPYYGNDYRAMDQSRSQPQPPQSYGSSSSANPGQRLPNYHPNNSQYGNDYRAMDQSRSQRLPSYGSSYEQEMAPSSAQYLPSYGSSYQDNSQAYATPQSQYSQHGGQYQPNTTASLPPGYTNRMSMNSGSNMYGATTNAQGPHYSSGNYQQQQQPGNSWQSQGQNRNDPMSNMNTPYSVPPPYNQYNGPR